MPVLAASAAPVVSNGLVPVFQRLRLRAYLEIACARSGRSVGSSNADPCAASRRGHDEKRSRRGSKGHMPASAGVTLENTRTAIPSGVQVAVREESP
jgi:hypothetical protein